MTCLGPPQHCASILGGAIDWCVFSTNDVVGEKGGDCGKNCPCSWVQGMQKRRRKTRKTRKKTKRMKRKSLCEPHYHGFGGVLGAVGSIRRGGSPRWHVWTRRPAAKFLRRWGATNATIEDATRVEEPCHGC